MADHKLTGKNLELALGFFDEDYYVSAHADLDLEGMDPFEHYLTLGWKDGFNPSEKFDGDAYLKLHIDVARAGMNPLLHYVLAGRAEGRSYVSLKLGSDIANPFDDEPLGPISASAEAAVSARDATVSADRPERVAPLEGVSLEFARARFDAKYYLSNHPLADLGGMTPFEHYLSLGWKLGYNPSRRFDGNTYLRIHADVAKAGINPLVHYAISGHAERRSLVLLVPGARIDFDYDTPRAYFSADYYVRNNPSLDLQGMDPYDHYMEIGWKKLYNPQNQFNTREYLYRNPDVQIAGMNPLAHYACFGVHEGRSIGSREEAFRSTLDLNNQALLSQEEHVVLARAQDFLLPMEIIDTEKLCVFVLPEHNAMSGGIFSIFSMANQLRRSRREHGYDVILMTRPNPKNLTYVRNSAFRNSETVYRFDQLRIFRNVRDLQLHVPEYATTDFVRNMSRDMIDYLLRRDSVHINILNQNIRFMPEETAYRDLRRIASSVGVSAAHHAYSTQDWADFYQLPTLLVPAYTDLSEYPGSRFSEKENLIITSDDDAPYRAKVEEKLKQLDDYTILPINGITFDKYMDLATRCKFSISYGEGFDGYVAQPIYQGAIGFALYTDEFFPNDRFLKHENFFATEDDMIRKIVPTIRALEKDKKRYETLNTALRAEWDALYSLEDYRARIGKLIRKEYEKQPRPSKAGGPRPSMTIKRDAAKREAERKGSSATAEKPTAHQPLNGSRNA